MPPGHCLYLSKWPECYVFYWDEEGRLCWKLSNDLVSWRFSRIDFWKMPNSEEDLPDFRASEQIQPFSLSIFMTRGGWGFLQASQLNEYPPSGLPSWRVWRSDTLPSCHLPWSPSSCWKNSRNGLHAGRAVVTLLKNELTFFFLVFGFWFLGFFFDVK